MSASYIWYILKSILCIEASGMKSTFLMTLMIELCFEIFSDKDGHHIRNGYALIIHNKRNFRTLPSREGSEKDVDAIKRFCSKAGLTLDDLKEDCTVAEIHRRCKKLASDKNLFSNYDGFVCFILSHGNRLV